METDELFQKIYGCLGGYIIGDAMGMPVEFLTPELIRKKTGRVKKPIKPVNHFKSELKAGEVTDDTKQTLALLKAFIDKGEINPRTTADALLKWAKEDNALEKSYTGPSTAKALKKLRRGGNPEETGTRGTTVGGAMRIPSVALLSLFSPNVIEKVALSCLPTHGTTVAISAASAVTKGIKICIEENATGAEVVSGIIDGAEKGLDFGVSFPAASVAKRIDWACSTIQKSSSESEISRKLYNYIGCGFAANEAVPTAVGVFYFAGCDPMNSIEMAVNMGGDTDTIAALAGSLGGAMKGRSAINESILDEILQINKIPLEEIVTSVVNYLQRDK